MNTLVVLVWEIPPRETQKDVGDKMVDTVTDLMEAKMLWKWLKVEGESFVKLKIALASSLVLHLPDLERQFVFITDAFDVAMGPY